MSKALRNMTERERFEAVERRISNGSSEKGVKGLGYWAAIHYRYNIRKIKSQTKSE